MPSRIRLVKHRLVLARLVTRMLREISAAYVGTDSYGSRADETLLLIAIFIGQAEQRPMTAAKLAEYAGIPRPTVIRKLRDLEKDGLLEILDGGAAVLSVELLNHQSVVDAILRCASDVQKAALELSKLDSKPIVQRIDRP